TLLSTPSIGRTGGLAARPGSCRIVLHCRQILTEMGGTNALGCIDAWFARGPRTNVGTRGPVQRGRCAIGADERVTMTDQAVGIAGGGPTGLMLAAELGLAQVDVAIVERRENQDLASVRAGGLHARTIEVFDQRGVADRFLSQGKTGQVASFSFIPLDLSDFPTRHNYMLALRQNHIARIMAGWVAEL